MDRCEFCLHEAGHQELCPMAFVLADENRKAAFGLGVSVAMSDWVEAAQRATRRLSRDDARTVWTASLSLLTQYHDRQHEAEMTALRETLVVPSSNAGKEGLHGIA